jgi:hypothetical protein
MFKKPRRRGLAAAGIAVAAGALVWTSLASGAGGAPPNRVVAKAVGSGHKLRYALSDDSIQSGGSLVIKNKSSAPHTLSLVEKNLVPRTNAQVNKCFNKGHICRAIASWHKATGNKPPKVKTVDVGKPGWDREGNLTRKGDSVFFGANKSPATRAVSAAPGTTLHFICAIHPWMRGTIHVK